MYTRPGFVVRASSGIDVLEAQLVGQQVVRAEEAVRFRRFRHKAPEFLIGETRRQRRGRRHELRARRHADGEHRAGEHEEAAPGRHRDTLHVLHFVVDQLALAPARADESLELFVGRMDVIAGQRLARFELGVQRDVARVGRPAEVDAPFDAQQARESCRACLRSSA